MLFRTLLVSLLVGSSFCLFSESTARAAGTDARPVAMQGARQMRGDAPQPAPLVWSGQAREQPSLQLVSRDDDVPEGCVNNMVCYKLDRDVLHPGLDDDFVLLYILFLLPFGELWGPLVMVDDASLNSDVITVFIVHLIAGVVASYVFWPLGIVIWLYLSPVTFFYVWDRALREDGVGGGSRKKARAKKKRRYEEDEEEEDRPRRRKRRVDDDDE